MISFKVKDEKDNQMMADFMTVMLERSPSLWKDCSFFTSVSSMIESLDDCLKYVLGLKRIFRGNSCIVCVTSLRDLGKRLCELVFPCVIFLTI